MDFKKTTWMDLEGIMLSEVSRRKTNAVWFYLYVESFFFLTLSAWFISLSIVPSRFIHVVVNLWKIFFFLSCFLYPFICQRTLGLFPCLSCCRWTAINERYRYLFEILTSFSSDEYSEVEMLNIIVELILIFWGTSILFAIEAAPIYISNNSGQGGI